MPIADLTDRARDQAPQDGAGGGVFGGLGGRGDDGGRGGRGDGGGRVGIVRGRAEAAAAADAATAGPITHRILSNPLGHKKNRSMIQRRCRENSGGDREEMLQARAKAAAAPASLLNAGDWKVLQDRTRQS